MNCAQGTHASASADACVFCAEEATKNEANVEYAEYAVIPENLRFWHSCDKLILKVLEIMPETERKALKMERERKNGLLVSCFVAS